jgi:broad specificity phosphatase PhoE
MPGNITISTIRHSETEFNKEKRYAGTIDVPLNEKGILDAIKASKRLKRAKFDVVITSDLQRSLETAELLINKKIPIVHTPLCNERNYGKLQGLITDQVKLIKPKVLFIEVGGDSHSVNPPEGEPFEILRERAQKFYRFILKNYMGCKILVVSHGTFLQQFNGLLLGKSCIESLAIKVLNLELRTFIFKNYHLISEKSSQLIENSRKNW